MYLCAADGEDLCAADGDDLCAADGDDLCASNDGKLATARSRKATLPPGFSEASHTARTFVFLVASQRRKSSNLPR